ncbi:hypothetical protein Afil01_58600 [Actinorhabdospora filicis]|uniref:Uncharacterized protein n=1 Tax=Actinorhabdospora filicis TaxID=1785913 RepID=A0A9W6WCG3_9ACTN|nr:hypothetical protein Afil01_58600 [Actinorhabdospora filicis]
MLTSDRAPANAPELEAEAWPAKPRTATPAATATAVRALRMEFPLVDSCVAIGRKEAAKSTPDNQPRKRRDGPTCRRRP